MTTMMVAAILVFGALGFLELGVSLFPDIDFPWVTVTTTWRNARPEEVETEITDILEDELGTISGVKHINSQNLEGISQIAVEFELWKDIDVAAQDVRDKVARKLGELPDDIDPLVIDKLDINAQPIIWLALSGNYPSEYLTEYVEDVIRPRLQALRGVGSVRIGGGQRRQVRIWLSREKLDAYGLTVSDIMAALRREHLELPGGRIETGPRDMIVRTFGEFRRPEDFNSLIVAERNGTAIRLRDLGVALDGREERQTVARFNRVPGVAMGVAPQSGANEVQVAELVRAELEKINRELPEGMQIRVANDLTRFIVDSISEVKFHLFFGGIMAIVSILFFLRDLRSALIAALAIPTSIIGTFGFMRFLGFTLNNMSMLGLTVAVGVVIDDAIVMVENIYRHLEKGGERIEAARIGSAEISFAVIATTAALLGVFAPVAFLRGLIGRFFYEFALTIAIAVLISMLVALTLTPMLASRLLVARPSSGESTAWSRLLSTYRSALTWALDHRKTVLALGLASFLAGLGIASLLGRELAPQEDQGRFMVIMETPVDYSIERTDRIVQSVEEILASMPEIRSYFAVTGFGFGGGVQSNRAVMFVSMVDHKLRSRSQHEVMAELRERMQSIPNLLAYVSYLSPLGGQARSEPLQFVVQGPDFEKLEQLSAAFMAELEKRSGIVDVDRDLELGKSEVRVHIDREKAADLGVSASSIASVIGAAIGGVDVVKYKEGGDSYDVRLRLWDTERSRPEDILYLKVRGADGRTFELRNFVTLERAQGPSAINRYDRQRSAHIFGNLEEKPLAAAVAEVSEIARRLLPADYSLRFVGQAEIYSEMQSNIAFAFFLAIIITYMILASQFESFVHPFTIMMALPLALIGAFGVLFLTGSTLNIFSLIGLVLLVGLVTKNSILLVEFTNQLRGRGLSTRQALLEAGPLRLRPIMMTAASTVAGVLPVVLGLGIGSEARQPMGLAVAGGMISSTLLTLIVVPVIYSYIDDLAARFRK